MLTRALINDGGQRTMKKGLASGLIRFAKISAGWGQFTIRPRTDRKLVEKRQRVSVVNNCTLGLEHTRRANDFTASTVMAWRHFLLPSPLNTRPTLEPPIVLEDGALTEYCRARLST
jgi:hypothetical protein